MINGAKVLDHSIRWAMVGGGKGSQIGYIHRSAALRDIKASVDNLKNVGYQTS